MVMDLILKYENEEKRQELIETNSTLRLVGEQILVDGNFLVFTDEEKAITLEDKVDALQDDVDYLILKQEGVI